MNALERFNKAKDEYVAEVELMYMAAEKIYGPDDPYMERMAAAMERMAAGLRAGRLQAERKAEAETPGIVAQMGAYLRSKAH
ncbi:hypothetical protein JCM15519_38540 [Fundidesulfovibrio butyratiphilus]